MWSLVANEPLIANESRIANEPESGILWSRLGSTCRGVIADELESRITQENERIQSEIDKLVQERQAHIASNNDELSKQRARYYNWQLKKKQDEQKIKDAISYFVNTGAPKPPSRTSATAMLQETLESEASAGGQ